MQNNRDIECIALMKSDKAASGLTLEYLFFNADGQILEKSRKIGLSEDTKLIYLFYRDEKLGPIMEKDYLYCKTLLENNAVAPDGAYVLLS